MSTPQYGPPDGLQRVEIEEPTPKDNENLVRVRAASVNPVDFHNLRGRPLFMRLSLGLLKPKDKRLGVDLAGVVEAVGRDVTRFKPGDEVFGARNDDLLALRELIEAGKVTPVIDRFYRLGETAAAIRYLETGRARGKVVVGAVETAVRGC